MPTAKIILYKSKILSNGEHPVLIQIYHHKINRIYIQKSCHAKYWDFKLQLPNKKHPNYRMFKYYIESRKLKVDTVLMQMEQEDIPFTVQEFKNRYKYSTSSMSYSDFSQVIIDRKIELGKLRTAEGYEYAQAKVETYLPGILLIEFDYGKLSKLEFNLRKSGSNDGGVSKILRNVRATINKAIQEGAVTYKQHPFSFYKIPTSKPRHSSINIEQLNRVIKAELPENLQFIRDIWISMFFLRGMEFIDIALLEESNLKGTMLTYIRRKTDNEFTITVPDIVLDIITKYKSGKKLFPILSNGNYYLTQKDLDEVKNKRSHHSRKMKTIFKKLEINVPVSTKTAKHSFGEIVSYLTNDIGIVQDLLGHKDYNTSKRYIGKKSEEYLSVIVSKIREERNINK